MFQSFHTVVDAFLSVMPTSKAEDHEQIQSLSEPESQLRGPQEVNELDHKQERKHAKGTAVDNPPLKSSDEDNR